MPIRTPLATAVKVNATAMVVAAIGIVIQIVAGVPGYPAVPPGPIILVAAAVAVVALRFRWAPIIGVLVPLFLLVGSIIERSAWDRVWDVGAFGPFVGSALQQLGVTTALVAGMLAVVQSYRTTQGAGHR